MSVNYERLFQEEVRDKKSLGRQIFSRVSTRKGGVNQALRTPNASVLQSYNNKKIATLSGDVEVYNLNTIIKYDDFKTKTKQQRRMFFEAWRDKYPVKDIIEGMGITKQKYYKIMDELGLQKAVRTGSSSYKGETVSLEELEKYMNDFIDWNLFKNLVRSQQFILLEKYLQDFPHMPDLATAWNNADIKYLYYVNSRMKEMKEDTLEEKKKKKDVVINDVNEIIPYEDAFKWLPEDKQRELLMHWREIYTSAEIMEKMRISSGTIHNLTKRLDLPKVTRYKKELMIATESEKVDEDVAETEQLNMEELNETNDYSVEESFQEKEEESEEILPQEDKGDDDNIIEETRQRGKSNNSLSIEINGNYSTNAIMKSIQSILETLENEEEVVNIDLKVRKR